MIWAVDGAAAAGAGGGAAGGGGGAQQHQQAGAQRHPQPLVHHSRTVAPDKLMTSFVCIECRALELIAKPLPIYQ
jgi:hypothetical protein